MVKLPKGSYLDFVISVRNTDRAPVPNLICNTYEEAATNIIANDLTIGTIMGPENNVSFSGMYVYKQEPMPGEGVFLPKGSPVILLTQQLGAGPEWGELQNKFNVAIYQALK